MYCLWKLIGTNKKEFRLRNSFFIAQESASYILCNKKDTSCQDAHSHAKYMLQKQPRSARESCKQDSFLLRKIRVSKASVDTVPRQIAQIKMSSFRCANHSDEPLDAKKCVQKRLPHFFVSHLHSTKSHSDVFYLCNLPRHCINRGF